MNAESREFFRQNLLRQLQAVAPRSLRVMQLQVGAISGGFDSPREEVEAELAYLADKALAVLAEKQISPENKHWRITAGGRDFLAEQGFA